MASTDFDSLAPNYRRACARWPSARGLGKHYALLSGQDLDGYGVVEAIKSFVESVCLTILRDFRQPMPAKPTLSSLFTAALVPLGMQNTRGASSIDAILSAFQRLLSALNEARNQHGATSHGKDGFFYSLTRDQNRAFLHTGDAVLAMLLNALDGTSPDLASTREPYERFQRFNERIDRAVTVSAAVEGDDAFPVVLVTVTAVGRDEAIPLRIEPSRLLYEIDREAFVEVLGLTRDGAPAHDADLNYESVIVAVPKRVEIMSHDDVHVRFVAGYNGRLAPLHGDLSSVLKAESIDIVAKKGGAAIVPSLLATADDNMTLDVWDSRMRQARLEVSLRRVLSGFGVRPAPLLASQLLAWLRVQSVGLA